MQDMTARILCILLIATFSRAGTVIAAQPTTETIRVGIPGKSLAKQERRGRAEWCITLANLGVALS
jgi:hypothetical protein